MPKGIFEGVNIVEFCTAVAGPMITKYLADQGATAVRVESEMRVDPMRVSFPYKDEKPGMNRSGNYATYHTNRYSLALNLKHPRSREVIEKLVKWADIVLENFSPGTMEDLGLGYDDLKAIKPDIIMARASIYGQTGPFRTQPGYGQQASALVGLTEHLGWPDRTPSTPYDGHTDFILPRFGAVALIAALDYRRRTGEGQCLDVCQYETALQFLSPLILDFTANGRETTRMGNASPYACPHGAYPCQGDDRWCAIAVGHDEQWQAFCQVLGNPEWTTESRFTTFAGRKKNEDEMERLVGTWTIDLPAEQVMGMMQAVGVPAGVLQTPRDLLLDPQLAYRQEFWLMNHPEMGEFYHLGQPFLLSKSPAQPRLTSPCLGEHTEYVCTELLGMRDEDFLELFTDGVLK